MDHTKHSISSFIHFLRSIIAPPRTEVGSGARMGRWLEAPIPAPRLFAPLVAAVATRAERRRREQQPRACRGHD
jgi:hypothetical protein